MKNKICIPTHEIFIGNEDEISQRIPTTYLGDKFDSFSVSFVSSSSTTEDDKEEDDDITDFEIGDYP